MFFACRIIETRVAAATSINLIQGTTNGTIVFTLQFNDPENDLVSFQMSCVGSNCVLCTTCPFYTLACKWHLDSGLYIQLVQLAKCFREKECVASNRIFIVLIKKISPVKHKRVKTSSDRENIRSASVLCKGHFNYQYLHLCFYRCCLKCVPNLYHFLICLLNICNLLMTLKT